MSGNHHNREVSGQTWRNRNRTDVRGRTKNEHWRTIMSNMLLIKYSEIGVKGKNRYIFEDMLVRNIKSALRTLTDSWEVRKADGRVYVSCAEPELEDAIEALKKVFGIAWICPMERIELGDFEKIRELALDFMKRNYFSGNEKETRLWAHASAGEGRRFGHGETESHGGCLYRGRHELL